MSTKCPKINKKIKNKKNKKIKKTGYMREMAGGNVGLDEHEMSVVEWLAGKAGS